MKNQGFLIFVLCLLMISVVPFSSAMAQSTYDTIRNRDQAAQTSIIMRDRAHQKRILDKFNDFYKRVRQFAPDLKMRLPMHPGHVAEFQDIREADYDSVYKKKSVSFAFVGDNYMLRSLPYDTIKQYIVKVTRGEKVQVLMMPRVKQHETYKNISGKWSLVQTGAGEQGYIPLNLLLQSPPRKHNSGGASLYHNNLAADTLGSMHEYRTERSTLQRVQDYGESGALRTLAVNADALNVRETPSQQSATVGTLRYGDEVEVLEYSGNEEYIDGNYAKWARVRLRYLEGWVFSHYLVDPKEIVRRDDSGRNESNPRDNFTYLKAGETRYVKSDILRVRDAPSSEGTVLFSVPHRESVRIISVNDEVSTIGGDKSKWVEIRYEDYEGWVFGHFLSVSSDASMQGDDIDKMFIFPFNNTDVPITSDYGWRMLKGRKSLHTGIDLGASCQTPILAAADGEVMLVKEDPRNCTSCGYGNYIILKHRNGYRTIYAHLTKIKVEMNQRMTAGQVIGTVGNTGHSYGCHLHFEVRAGEEHVDPKTYIHP